MKKDLYDIIIRPILTEKSNFLHHSQNKIVLRVRNDVNKLEIKRAVEEVLRVRVLRVNTLIVRGKTKRVGRRYGKLHNWKKAIVFIHKDDNVDFFEGT